MKKPYFAENEIYHIYNRGVEKRDVFMSDKDHFRFIHDLYEFNDEEFTERQYRYSYQFDEVQPRQIGIRQKTRPRKLLVEILAFALMPNHFHLLLRQKREDGIVKFMQKIGTGYAMYFNKKYDRVGSLFQGRFKAVLVKQDAHFIHLPYYIHTNPLDLKNDEVQPRQFLENYRWSSFLDYIGKKNFPSVTSRDFLLDFFGGTKDYKKATYKWINEKSKNMHNIQGVILENE